jgi:hypothetical protein
MGRRLKAAPLMRNALVQNASSLQRHGSFMDEVETPEPKPLYCPACQQEMNDPLVCGDCGAIICRRCGTPLEGIDELGIG